MSAVVLRGDAAHLPLPDASVDLICTSPPYFGQRDYRDGGESVQGQIGSEQTPREYIAALLGCTAEWMRVLKPEGSIFVNLGDSYYSGKGAPGRTTTDPKNAGRNARRVTRSPLDYGLDLPRKTLIGLPWRYALGCIDDLGLTLRAEIIWDKPNGMPESVTDRVRRSHEQVFHFVRQERHFAAVDELREQHQPQSIARTRRNRFAPDLSQEGVGSPNTLNPADACNPLGKLPGSVWRIPTMPLAVPKWLGVDHFAAYPLELCRRIILGWSPSGVCTRCAEGRRPVPSAVALDMNRPQARRAHQLAEHAGLTEDHLAALLSVGVSDTGRGAATQSGTGKNTAEVYALADVARSVLGGYAREYLLRRPAEFGYVCSCTPRTDHPERRGKDFHAGTDRASRGMNDKNGGERYRRYVEEQANPRGPVREYDFANWTPPPTRRSLIVDPFGGTGTTALVAASLGRIGISIDRSMDYSRLGVWRTTDPGERARALGVPKPPPELAGQDSLFDLEAS